MRIDLNPAAQALPESGRSPNQSSASGGSAPAAGSPRGEDQAQLSGTHAQIESLVAQALQLPDVRQEKVNSLRQAVQGGSYRPSASQVAESLFSHLAGGQS